MVQIRGREIPIATTMVGGYPRPHWLQGRVFGWGDGPLYTSMTQRVAYEDALALCVRDQQRAGLDLLADGMQYEDYEAHGFQIDRIMHHITEFLGGLTNFGLPNPMKQWSAYYLSECTDRIDWKRSIYQGVVDGMQRTTDQPFKLGIVGPAQLVLMINDLHYNDQRALALDLAAALNQELRYLKENFNLEAVQIVDISPHYVKAPWQAEANCRVFEGLDDVLKVWHVCYGRTEGQVAVFENKVAEVISVFADTNVDVLMHEMAGRNYAEIDSFRKFPEDRILCAGVINDHELQVEQVDEVVEGIHRVLDVIPAERLMVAQDCGLRWLPRHVAAMKLNVMCEAANIVRAEL
jgi:5-methyltetrahydropteroyltriglutamate--homocysteine methyltransferase